MKVELFHAPGCEKCAASRKTLREAAQRAMPSVEWREVDVTAETDYAVQLGVLTTPAVAIEGELVFASLPTPAELGAALLRRKAKEKHGR